MPESPTGTPANFYQGTGRRKEAIARVVLRPGSGKMDVNGKPSDEYFHSLLAKERDTVLQEPFRATGTVSQFDTKAKVSGGGMSAQLTAMQLGIARALLLFNPDLRSVLRKRGMVTRDPRMKERKKYGQKGARKRFQYSKR
ncbi:MAG TPA: 30S ribosomal protein S9 [Candidatus Acidoferrales bacterium]|nr:30S ribosomal protein S9 [Candidatus Acidoferrales bacterium]